MIKFFRNIRHQLLRENRTSRYLLYAIGEIVLVVIGILIALQINNWNENRKLRQKEQTVLKQLKQEFEANLHQLNGKIEIRNTVIKNGQKILDYIDNPNEVAEDSLIIKIAGISNPSSFDPIQNDLVSSGNIDIIQNQELTQLLTNWTSDVIQLQEVEQMYFRYFENQILPFINENGIGRNMVYFYYSDVIPVLLESAKIENVVNGKSSNAKDAKSMLGDSKFESLISYAISLNTFNNQESKTLKDHINSILVSINSQIE